MEQALDILIKKHDESYHRRAAEAEAEAAAIGRQRENVRNVEGLGRLKYEIPAGAAKEWIAQEGPNVLRDPDFMKYQKRKNPHLFTKNGNRGNRVGYGD